MTDDDAPVDRGASGMEPPLPVETTWEDGEHPSTAIVRAVAAVTDREPTALPLLHESVDGEALDALVTRKSSSFQGAVQATFSYAGVSVSVDSDGGLEVLPGAGSRA